jgi:hypothetical protein
MTAPMTAPITWSIPVGIAADKKRSQIARMKAYRETHTTQLKNGVRPTPKLETIQLILSAYDLFKGHLAVEESGYYLG